MRAKSPKVSQKILKAARSLFLERGYAQTSMESVANKAQVSKATVYSHFKSKEDLFRALVADFCDGLLEQVPPPQVVDDVEQQLLNFANRIFTKMLESEKADWDRMLISQAKRFPQLTEIYYEIGPVRATERMTEFLRINGEAGNLKVEDPEFSAEMFFGMLLGTRLYKMLLFPHLPTPTCDQTPRLVRAFMEVHRP